MEYTFNPEKIKQLAEGRCQLKNKETDADMPTVELILSAAFPKDQDTFYYAPYYKRHNLVLHWWVATNGPNEDLPIYEIADFIVSPTKEEKQTIESIDARLKELSEKYAELETMVKTTRVPYPTYEEVETQAAKARAAKEEQSKAEWKVGEWAWSEITKTTLSLITAFEDNLAFVNNQNGLIECWEIVDMVKPTKQEVGDYLIGLAKKRYPVGTKLRFNEGKTIYTIADVEFDYNKREKALYGRCNEFTGWLWVYGNGVWAEVLPQAKEEFFVTLQEYPILNYYYIEVERAGKALTKEQAEHYQAIIKNALNG